MKLLSRRHFCLSSGALCASAMVNSASALQKALPTLKSGYAFHNDFASFWNNHAETYLRAEWINTRLVQTGVQSDLALITPYPDPMEFILKLHTQEHVDWIDSYNASMGFSLTIGQVARTAVGHVLGAVKAVCEGAVRNAFCCIRPPGHHVQNGGELGYCCYANVVLAAKFAREKYNLRRILIIDWDYHQGNGTHGFICGDNDILFFETFNPPMYSTTCDDFIIKGPDFAFPEEARRLNIQMPDGSTNDDIVRVFESKLVPAAERFKPELVLISCGFDLKKYDSHGTFDITANGVSRLTRILRQIADTYAGGKLVSLLEGGYEDYKRDKNVIGSDSTFSGLSQCAENHVKTLITGNEYPETPYYKGASSISRHTPGNGQHRNIGLAGSPPVKNGLGNITITDTKGRVVKKIYQQSDTPLSAKNLHLARGRYFASFKGSKGNRELRHNISH